MFNAIKILQKQRLQKQSWGLNFNSGDKNANIMLSFTAFTVLVKCVGVPAYIKGEICFSYFNLR